MARSKIRTWLPIDRWAEIIGLNPFHWNQLSSATLLPNNVCGDVWFTYAWQHSDRVGRDEVAMAIQAAEREISAEAGFNLLPDWTLQERIPFAEPAIPGLYSLDGLNPRGMFQSIELRKGHVISGGVREKTAIQIGAPIVRTDLDGDGYQETCVLTVPTAVTDPNEVHVYYPAQAGSDAWEIRPIRVDISGGIAIVQFKIWQVAAAGELEDPKANVINADIPGSFETGVDVYRVFNNPSVQVQFMWENAGVDCCGTCVACQFGTQAGCFHMRDARLGIAVPAPGTWNVTDQGFDEGEWNVCRAPDQARFWYYSGWRDMTQDMPYVQIDPFWEYAVAYYAASKLDRPVCGCSNAQQFIDKWKMDLLINKADDRSFNVTPEMLSNKLGTTMGALYAWKRVHQNGVRVLK